MIIWSPLYSSRENVAPEIIVPWKRSKRELPYLMGFLDNAQAFDSLLLGSQSKEWLFSARRVTYMPR